MGNLVSFLTIIFLWCRRPSAGCLQPSEKSVVQLALTDSNVEMVNTTEAKPENGRALETSIERYTKTHSINL